ncbi:MAG: glycosyltransferase family 9 protein [Gemmatimonadaceae bacterium]
MTIPLDRVCIVMMSAVGDAVHVLPVVNAIKRHSPRSRITWVVQPGPDSLVRGHPSVDETIVFNRAAGLRAFRDIRAALDQREFDVVLNLQVYFKAGVVTAFTRSPVKLGFDRVRARDMNTVFTTHTIPPHAPQHVQDQYFEFLTYLGVPHEPVEWGLGPWESELPWQRSFVRQFDRPLASVVVATSKPAKDWAPERWAEVCDALYADYGLQPVLVGGGSERERLAERIILETGKHPPFSALGSGLRNLVGILDASALVLAPDTGPLHMAVALDRPVISLMGYTNPRRSGPYRKFHDLIVDGFADPGERYDASAKNRPGRMRRIVPRDVLDKVDVWKARYSAAALSSPPKR